MSTSYEAKARASRWELPPGETNCQYPDVVFDPSLNVTRNGGCSRLYIQSSIRTTWTEKAYARAWIEDRTLVEAISHGLVRVPLEGDDYSLRESVSLHDDPETDMSTTNLDMIALSYVHQTNTSAYGLAKLPEPVERALIDGIRRRAKDNGVDRVFIWSDQTIKGRIDNKTWLKVGIYAYAVLSGLVVPTNGYTSRLWPMVEFSLLESCAGFIIDVQACSEAPGFDFSSFGMLINSSASDFKNGIDIDCYGFGNTVRDGIATMSNRFLTTQLGQLETHYQDDRILLKEITVSWMKGEKKRSIGHHLLCGPECPKRKLGSLTNFMVGISSRAFLDTPDYCQSSALWGMRPFASPLLTVFRSKNGFIRNISDILYSSARRTSLPSQDIDKYFTALCTLASKFSFASNSGYIGVLNVINFNMSWTSDKHDLDSGMPYWSSPGVLAWIEVEADESGNKKWPGASMKLDQMTTSEIDTLLRLHCRFYKSQVTKSNTRDPLERQCKTVLDMMRLQLDQMPGHEMKNTILQQMETLGIDNKNQDALLDVELLEIIAQEIEQYGMVQKTGILHMVDYTLKAPYKDIKSVVCSPQSLRLTLEKNPEPYKKALNWIFIEDRNSGAREPIGICGRICMSAIYGTVGSEAFNTFLAVESPFLLARNRPSGKRHVNQNAKYVLHSDGYWKLQETKDEESGSKNWTELPQYGLVVYDEY